MSENKKRYYKGIQVNSFGIPIFNKRPNLNKQPNLRKRTLYGISFSSSFEKDASKNLIVMYDIPSNQKKERDWFRRHLKKFNYIMIQKSVWVGPSPLPKDFLEYVKSIGLERRLKTFKLAKSYSGKGNIL